MFGAVLEALLDTANAIVRRTALSENIGLKNLSISLVILIVTLSYAIRWLAKGPKPRDERPEALPDECVLAIFQHLSISDLKRSAQVCRQFDRVSKDDKLWFPFCRRDFRVRHKKEMPVWLTSWHDFYVYHFKYMTSLNILWVLGTYWRVVIRKSRYFMILFLMLLPFLLGLLTILFLHYYAQMEAEAVSISTSTGGKTSTISTSSDFTFAADPRSQLGPFSEANTAAAALERITSRDSAPDTSIPDKSGGFFGSFEIPRCSGDTCIWLALVGIAVNVLVWIVIPAVSFILSYLEPIFLHIGLGVFAKDENAWKYMEEHKSTTVLLGATLLTTLLVITAIALLAWRISVFAKLNWRSRREKFTVNLRKNWNDFRQSKSRQLRRRLREVGLMDDQGRLLGLFD